jgi:hypothetical protein
MSGIWSGLIDTLLVDTLEDDAGGAGVDELSHAVSDGFFYDVVRPSNIDLFLQVARSSREGGRSVDDAGWAILLPTNHDQKCMLKSIHKTDTTDGLSQ